MLTRQQAAQVTTEMDRITAGVRDRDPKAIELARKYFFELAMDGKPHELLLALRAVGVELDKEFRGAA